ncbi:Xaa-Pro dipeptidase [Entamoeba marina]
MSKLIQFDLKALHKSNTAHFLKYFKPETQGGLEIPIYDTDVEYLFQQEGNFHYLFGVKEAGFLGIIHMDGKRVLFFPQLPEALQIVLGKNLTADEVKEMYGVEEVYFDVQIEEYLAKINPTTIYINANGVNTDSGAEPAKIRTEAINKYKINDTELHDILFDARTVKTTEEIDLMRKAVNGTAEAHKCCMKNVDQELTYGEYGMRYFAYCPICASGVNSAVLHYGHAGRPNRRLMKDGEMVLMDLGTQCHRYATDLTFTYPINGKFTEQQKQIYSMVLNSKNECEKLLRPGIRYYEVQVLAHKLLLKGLVEIGILKGDVEEMYANEIGYYFMPHGIGHLIGIETHDVGGFVHGIERKTNPSMKSCRSNRILEEGNVYTIEPGCYFIDYILNRGLNDEKTKKYFVEEKLRVRIEDNVLVTKDGCEILNKDCPRTVEEVEEFMKH